MKKGFTLIELLAVIVVLAIIALIVTPVISNVIKGAKKSATEQSITSYVKAIDSTNQASMLLNNPVVINNASATRMGVDIKDLDVEVNGKKPEEGYVDIVNNKVIRAIFCVDNYIAEYLNGKVDLEETEDCKKEVTYITYDMSDTENQFANIEASTLDPSWIYYVKKVSYGGYLIEVSVCNKTSGEVTCVSSNDVLTKENLVKESNNGILISDRCYDLNETWIEEENNMDRGSDIAIDGFGCDYDGHQYLTVNYASSDPIIEKMTHVTFGANLPIITPSCSIDIYSKLSYFPEVMNKYVNMSRSKFLKLTVDDITDLLTEQISVVINDNSYDDSSIYEHEITEEVINAEVEKRKNQLRANSEEFQQSLKDIYTDIQDTVLLKLGGHFIDYSCYHYLGD